MYAYSKGKGDEMQKEGIVTAIDVGTTKVCTIVAKVYSSEKVKIIGVGIEPSRGLRKGMVVNVEEARKAIRASVKKAEQQSGVRVRGAYVGVTGSHIQSKEEWLPIIAGKEQTVVTGSRLNAVRRSLTVSNSDDSRQVLHAIARGYALDGTGGIKNPVGMHAHQLEMHTQVVTGVSALFTTLTDAVTGAGVEMLGLVLEPLASGEAVLTDAEKELGVVMVDIGGGTSDVAIFKGGDMVHTFVIPVGGYQFTNDLATMFDASYEEAEQAKLKYGGVNLDAVTPGEEVEIPAIGQTRTVKVQRQDICRAMKERSVELLQLIKAKLIEAKLQGGTDSRVVLTGGSANIPGLDGLAKRILTANVRVGTPRKPAGMPEVLINPSYSTSVGILLWCMKEYSLISENSNGNTSVFSFYSRFINWLLGRIKSVAAFRSA